MIGAVDWEQYLPPEPLADTGPKELKAGQVWAWNSDTGRSGVVRIGVNDQGGVRECLASGYGRNGRNQGALFLHPADDNAHHARLVQDVNEPAPRDPSVVFGTGSAPLCSHRDGGASCSCEAGCVCMESGCGARVEAVRQAKVNALHARRAAHEKRVPQPGDVWRWTEKSTLASLRGAERTVTGKCGNAYSTLEFGDHTFADAEIEAGQIEFVRSGPPVLEAGFRQDPLTGAIHRTSGSPGTAEPQPTVCARITRSGIPCDLAPGHREECRPLPRERPALLEHGTSEATIAALASGPWGRKGVRR